MAHRTFSSEFKESFIQEIKQARASGLKGAVTRLLEREKISSGTLANWEHGTPKNKRKGPAPRAAKKRMGRPPDVTKGYRLTYVIAQNHDSSEHETIEKALEAYGLLAATSGVSNLRLWEERKVRLVVNATVEE